MATPRKSSPTKRGNSRSNNSGNNQRGNSRSNNSGNNQRGNSRSNNSRNSGNNQRGNNQRNNQNQNQNQDFDNELRGALFVNNRGQSNRSPDWTGKLTIDGKEWWVSGWWKTPRGNGDDYISLALTDPDSVNNNDQNGEEQYDNGDDQGNGNNWEPDNFEPENNRR